MDSTTKSEKQGAAREQQAKELHDITQMNVQ